MNAGNGRLHARRIALTAFVGVFCGAFAGKLVGGELLGLSEAWQTALWCAGALFGGSAEWARADSA